MAHTVFETDGPVATLTFNRPEARNAMTWEMYAALVAACEPAQQPIAEAIAQPPAVSKVYYPDPAEGSADGQVFEY